jgi:hypothetical protein
MKHSGKLLICVMSGLAFCTTARAVPADSSESSDNPYQSIVDRNVFSLKPPPPPADPAEVNKPTVVKITLTGVTTILGNKRVLMKTAPPPGKPGQGPASEQSYILTEGQREGDIEVIEIDEKLGSVKVNNGGTIQTLTFEKDGAKLPVTAPPPTPAAGGVPGAGAIPGLPLMHPNGTSPAPGSTTPSFQLPTRVPRLPVTGAQANGVAPGGAGQTPYYGAPGYLPGNTTTPIMPGGAAVGNTTSSPFPNGSSQVSAEEQAILIEAARQAGGAAASLLPPTPLTPKANQNPAQTSPVPAPSFPPLPGRAPGSY